MAPIGAQSSTGRRPYRRRRRLQLLPGIPCLGTGQHSTSTVAGQAARVAFTVHGLASLHVDHRLAAEFSGNRRCRQYRGRQLQWRWASDPLSGGAGPSILPCLRSPGIRLRLDRRILRGRGSMPRSRHSFPLPSVGIQRRLCQGQQHWSQGGEGAMAVDAQSRRHPCARLAAGPVGRRRPASRCRLVRMYPVEGTGLRDLRSLCGRSDGGPGRCPRARRIRRELFLLFR